MEMARSVVQGYRRCTFEFKDVLAALSRLSLSFRSTGVERSSRYSTTFFAAFAKDSAICRIDGHG